MSEFHPAGKYEQVGKFNAYVTGNPTSSIAIVEVTDAYGLVPSVIQGADLLAKLLDALVILPDYFDGEPALLTWIDEDGEPIEETKSQYMAFVKEKAQSPDNLPNVIRSVEEAKLKWPAVKSWIGLGLGWGGKLIAHASGENTPFKASGQAYPSKPTREDVEKFTIPHICLASRTDNPDGIKAYAEILTGEGKVGYVETYSTMYHGWMGARAVMSDPETVMEYNRGFYLFS
ncbi:dienelactone hydrolase [Lipomyces kononenkoae]